MRRIATVFCMVSAALALPAAAALAEEPPPTPTSHMATPTPMGSPGTSAMSGVPAAGSGAPAQGVPGGSGGPGGPFLRDPDSDLMPPEQSPVQGAAPGGATKQRPGRGSASLTPANQAPGRPAKPSKQSKPLTTAGQAPGQASAPGTEAQRNPGKSPTATSRRLGLKRLLANEDTRLARMDAMIKRLEKLEDGLKERRKQTRP